MKTVARFCIMIVAVMTALCVSASPVSESSARILAGKFLSSKGLGSVNTPRLAGKAKAVGGTDATYYVFNSADSKAWVMIAGDDAVEPVLAYGDKRAFNDAEMPENVRYWLSQYDAQIAAIQAGKGSAMKKVGTGWTKIAPMIKTHWDQGEPFNLKCPSVNGELCVTGCVATAIAQVMYYHRWPEQSKAIDAYTTSGGLSVDALPEVTFEWDKMQTEYLSTDTGDAADAVATLMRYAGQMVSMNYTTESSGASSLFIDKLVDKFDYASTVRIAIHDYIGGEEWASLVYNELKARRPILYCGSKLKSGHEFVCDGYDGDGKFHFNWGWGGSFDGYFSLDLLNPNGGGTGSVSGHDGYINYQEIVLGLKPSNQLTDDDPTTAIVNSASVTGNTTFTRSSSSENFENVGVTAGLYNLSATTNYYLGWMLYEGNNALEDLTLYRSDNWGFLKGRSIPSKLTFGAGLADGTYRLVPILYRMDGNNPLQMADGGNTTYIQAVISGNTLTLTPIGSSSGSASALNTSYTLQQVNVTDCNPNKTATVALLLTNTGTVDHGNIIMSVDNDDVTITTTDIKPGETGIVYAHYMPLSTGSNTLKFYACDRQDNRELLGSYTATASAKTGISLNMTLTDIEDIDGSNTVDGDYINATFTLTNRDRSSNTFNDKIKVILYRSLNNGYMTTHAVTEQQVSVLPGKSKKITISFPNLIAGDYAIRYYYYNETDYYQAGQQGWITVTGKTSILGDVNCDGIVDVSDVVALANYVMGETPDPFDESVANVNGDEIMDVSDVVALANLIMGEGD